MTIFIISFVVIFSLLCFLVFYRRIYFKPVSALCCSFGSDPILVSVKPNSAFFKSHSSGSSGFVHLGSNCYCFYVNDDDLDKDHISFKGISINKSCYIFKRNRLGRFISIDLSDRTIHDILSKF